MPFDATTFSEHRISRDAGQLYARDYPGAGPAFVLMHGFPDNLHIYDELIPYLVADGRRVVTFDFLGFGESDRFAGAACCFEQHLEDSGAFVEALRLDKIIPVGHAGDGPAASNLSVRTYGRPVTFPSREAMRNCVEYPRATHGPRGRLK